VKTGKFLIIALCALAAAALLGWSFRNRLFTASFRLPQEFEAAVAAMEEADGTGWVVKKAAVIQEGAKGAYVFRLEKLRAKRTEVFPIGLSGERVIIQARLEPGDLILADPLSAWDGAAIAVTGGIDQASLVKLTLDAARF
jgi:hypothetical protein